MVSIQPRFGFVLEYVADVDAAKRWYEDVFGLVARRYHPTFVQFDNFAIASDEALAGERKRELYWIVEDAEAAFAALTSEDAEIVFPIKTINFGKVFAVKEPAGEILLLCEFA